MVRSVLFVCTGNICRSPMAHGLLVREAAARGLELRVDSAATSDLELGNPPDRRTRLVATRRGCVLPDHRARLVVAEDFRRFDLILGMSRQHELILRRRAPADRRDRVGLLMRYAAASGPLEVPDPWWGGLADYERAFDLIAAGVEGLLARIEATRDRALARHRRNARAR